MYYAWRLFMLGVNTLELAGCAVWQPVSPFSSSRFFDAAAASPCGTASVFRGETL
jgi:hypothetical protein